MSALNCFKTCDIRGDLGVNLDASTKYRFGRNMATEARVYAGLLEKKRVELHAALEKCA